MWFLIKRMPGANQPRFSSQIMYMLNEGCFHVMLLLLPNIPFFGMYVERDEPTAVRHKPSPMLVYLSQCRFFSATTVITPCMSICLRLCSGGSHTDKLRKISLYTHTCITTNTDSSVVRLILCIVWVYQLQHSEIMENFKLLCRRGAGHVAPMPWDRKRKTSSCPPHDEPCYKKAGM